MNKIPIAALLGLGLYLGLQGCQYENSQELAPSASEAPQGLQSARFLLDEVP